MISQRAARGRRQGVFRILVLLSGLLLVAPAVRAEVFALRPGHLYANGDNGL